MKKALPLVVVAGSVVVIPAVMQAVAWAQAAADSSPKYTIEEVMEKAHKEELLNKVAEGEATAEQKVELLDLYLSLLENDPPKGDAESFHKLASDAVAGAARVVVGRNGAESQIKKAVNCMACHRDHRPEE